MSTSPQTSAAGAWVDLILGTVDPAETWTAIFARLRELSLSNPGAATLHRETIVPDRLLAESAWDLWQQFPRCAPTVVGELKRFWISAAGVGTAVLILDGISLRELPLIVAAGQQRGRSPVRVEVRGAEVPTETDRFAEALGLPSRSKLYNNKAPGTFVFAGPDVYTDVLDAPFVDCVGAIPVSPRLFVWHKWPDEPLIHLHEDKKDGPAVVAAQTKSELAADGFWKLVDRLRQGRRLVITGDHGYADSNTFSNEEKNEDTVKLLRSFFGAARCAKEDSAKPWPRQHLPPLVCRHNGWLVVMGQRKWAVQGGFPNLCHRGLSLLEAAIPYLEFAPK
ncbi:MAG: hypothetical protein ABSG53_18840 [Thermoguttaceae bacterium]